MRENKVKRALSQGGVAVGTMVFEFNTTGIARIAGAAGADFLLYDTEHTGWSSDTVRLLMAAARSADVVPLVRVPATYYHLLARTLDVGAMGLMVPMVATAAQAELIVQSCKYPPEGMRGAAFGLAHDDYQGGDIVEKMRSANREQLLIAMVETTQGLANVDEIARVDGIDVLWVGQFDLTSSMGIPGQFTHSDYLRSLDRVLDACARHGKVGGFMAASVAEGIAMLAKGFRCLAYWGDLWIYGAALDQGLSAIRAGSPASRPTS